MKLIQTMIRGLRLAMTAALVAGPAGPLWPAGANAAGGVQAAEGQLKLPQYFEANHGQTDPSVKFFTRAGGYDLYLTATEAVMVTPAGPSAETGVLRMQLKGANPSPAAQGLEALPGYTNYLRGDSSQWRTGVSQYGKVKFSGVYPGIDMVYRFEKGNVVYDFIVAPGARPGRILLGFEGAEGLRLDAKGNLLVRTGTGEMTFKSPYLYQTLNGERVPVTGRFALASNNRVRFKVGKYVKSEELIIDPALSYSSFLGGTVDDRGKAVIVDADGNAYVTGWTQSAATFPGAVAGQYQVVNNGGMDIFVTKVNPDGTAILWSTYFGGAGDDVGRGIGIDDTSPHKVYITGSTTGLLPGTTALTNGVLGGTDGFVTAFAADGKSLVYSRQFGGAETDMGNGIAVDGAGNAYVTGVTGSIAIDTFPTTPLSAQPNAVAGAATDAFVIKLNSAGDQVYGSYLGGTGIDKGNAIAIDAAGKAYIAGQAGDAFVSTTEYPTVFKNTVTGANDAFIVIMDATGANFVYKTYVGGSGIDEATGIALDSVNNVYITGHTFSADFPDGGVPFATIGQTTIGTAPDGFVFKLKPFNGGGHDDGIYATYLGGSNDDRATAIVVDDAFYAYVTGITFSGDFPMVDPISGGGTLVGLPEAFVTQVGPTGGVLGFSTYLGGTTMTGGQGIALDTSKNIFVTGWTNSTAPTFPIVPVPGAFQQANAGSFDAFIAKFGSAVPPPSACVITGVDPDSGFTIGGTTVTITGTDFVAYSGPGGVTFDGVNARSYTVNAASTVITAVTPRHPVTGTLVAGPVNLAVTTTAGTCTAVYTYVLSADGTCVDEYFFPSPVKGARGNFAYCMAKAGTVKIMVYNAIGDLVTKIEDSRGSGAQLSQINTGRLASGVYLYRLEKDYGGGDSAISGVRKFVVRH